MKLQVGIILAFTASAQTVWFEPNRGQVAGQTEWIGRSKGAYLYITGDEVVYANKTNLHMRLVGSSRRTRVEGLEPTGGISSYFTGRDEKTWVTGIPHYAKIRYRDVYPGIDVVYYGSGRNVEYDFVVQPGADPGRIELAFSEPVKIVGGDLVVAGLRQHRPRVTQGGSEIAAEYRIASNNHIQIALSEYDHSRVLTVDPLLEFSTYLGGPGQDIGTDIKLESAGNIWLAGETQSPATPSLDPFQQTNLTAYNAFVLKMTPDAKRVLLFTVLGATASSVVTRMVLDGSANPILAGRTQDPQFPIKNAFESDYRAGYFSGFVTKLASDGRSLIYSSFLGGTQDDAAYAVAVDSKGNAYFTGFAASKDGFPIKNALQPTYGGGWFDGFVTKVAPDGTLLWSTYYGSPGNEDFFNIVIAPDGNPIMVGSANTADFPLKNPIQTELTPRTGLSTPVLVKLSADGQSVLFSTFLGGPTSGGASGLALDSAGNLLITGSADGRFATKNALQTTHSDSYTGFIMKLDAALRSVIFATYFGGLSGDSAIMSSAFDGSNAIYVYGRAGSDDFPVKNSLQKFLGGGILHDDCFIAKLAPSGTSLIYSTLFGGSGNENCSGLAVDRSGSAYVVGTTLSTDFPGKNAYQPRPGGDFDVFLAKISDATPLDASPLTPSPGRVLFRFVQGGPLPTAQTVTVTGGPFVLSGNVPWITATAAGSTVNLSMNPAGLAANTYNGSVTLTPQAGGVPATIDVALTVLAPAPVLTSIDPAVVPEGSDDTVITVHGSGFAKDSVLQVNGLPWLLSPVQFVDSSTLKFTLPVDYLKAEYNHTVAVQNANSPPSNVLSVSVGKPAPAFTAASVANAASFAAGPVAPGEIVTVFGSNLLGTVTFDNIPATVIYSSVTQMSVTVPYTVQGPTTTLKVGTSAPVRLDVARSAPGIFAAVSDPVNNIVTLYATGCGPLSAESLPRCTLPVSVTINDQDAPVLYAGIAPGLPEGANQINAQLPTGVSGPVDIVLKAGGVSSKDYQFTLP